MSETSKIILVGNPNSGKSTLFNALTGLHQQIGNYPGVTVTKKVGHYKYKGEIYEVTDLPGTYSIFHKTLDEQVATDQILSLQNTNSIVVCVADATNLKRSLLLCTQIIDLKIPCVLALNMIDISEKRGLTFNLKELSIQLGIEVVTIKAKRKEGIEELKQLLSNESSSFLSKLNSDVVNHDYKKEFIGTTKTLTNEKKEYAAFVHLCNHTHKYLDFYNPNNSEIKHYQRTEIFRRYQKINSILELSVKQNAGNPGFTSNLDRFFTHKIFGYLLFFGILFSIFQAIFSWASYPMELIGLSFENLSGYLTEVLPNGILKELLINGIVAGLSGIAVFVPQIALLFGFIAILEESGYMARVSFIMDKIMRQFGLNGKSVIPLISATACAVPAIMSTRNINNWQERMTTIFVMPLMSCSARLPVYTILIALIIPEQYYLGLNLQGLVLMGMYLLGFITAILTAILIQFIMKTKERSHFILELPIYRLPSFRTTLFLIINKVKIFLFDAGKIIIAISIILWALSSYGPNNSFETIEKKYENAANTDLMASEKLEASYTGIIGKTIEPVIKPLGYDWKMGIAIITSFAAREVFVGTLATLYSVGNSSQNGLLERLKEEKNPETGKPAYDFSTGISLLIFYAFALQCMSTVVVTKNETNSWKWTIYQLLFMSGLAYIAALIVFQLLQ